MNPNWVHKHGPKRLRRAMKKHFTAEKRILNTDLAPAPTTPPTPTAPKTPRTAIATPRHTITRTNNQYRRKKLVELRVPKIGPQYGSSFGGKRSVTGLFCTWLIPMRGPYPDADAGLESNRSEEQGWEAWGRARMTSGEA